MKIRLQSGKTIEDALLTAVECLKENEENYQNKTISMLSKELTRKFGKGFSCANIWNMITFYKEYGSVQTLSERLSWSYYC